METQEICYYRSLSHKRYIRKLYFKGIQKATVMIGKKVVFISFGAIFFVLAAVIFSADSLKKVESIFRYSSGGSGLRDLDEVENFTDSLKKYIDTSFYAEYRGKSDQFEFLYLIESGFGNSFLINDYVRLNIFETAKQLQIRRVWKYENENFFRFEIFSDEKINETLFVLESPDVGFRSLFFANSGADSLKIGDKVNITRYNSLERLSRRTFLSVLRK